MIYTVIDHSGYSIYGVELSQIIATNRKVITTVMHERTAYQVDCIDV